MSAVQQIHPHHLVVVHYHLRPGGVRRVIELTLPDIVAAYRSLQRVTLMVGEAQGSGWVERLRSRVRGVNLDVVTDPNVGYFSESADSASTIRANLHQLLTSIVADGEETLIWAHNLGLARNLILASELAIAAARPHVRLVSHHHDFWFENRWNRWPEFSPSGAESLDAVADVIFSKGAKVAFATINRFDLRGIAKHAKKQSAWLPNPAEFNQPPDTVAVAAASAWLHDQLGDNTPVWVIPARFLRRKNIAEAMLLTRWLCPHGWLVTTAAASSADEIPVFEALSQFAKEHKMRCRFAILANTRTNPPDVSHLIAASTGVIVTSIQEGFGLPYLEASAAGKPIIARCLPNVFPDLQRLGLRFSNSYNEVWIHSDLLDIVAEQRRQRERWQAWMENLPPVARRETGEPWIFGWRQGAPVAFSRLTLEGQMDVLSKAPADSWQMCRRWNRPLQKIQDRIQTGTLQPDEIAPTMIERLSTQFYAESFRDLAGRAAVLSPTDPAAIQRGMLVRRLNDEFVYPLLW
jgi:glycosyltransferase involved in cell wall biosynthesis